MVINNDKSNNKEQKQEVQGKEKTRQSETQRTVRTKIKEIVPNLKERGAREEKKINMVTEDKRGDIFPPTLEQRSGGKRRRNNPRGEGVPQIPRRQE